MLDLRLADVGRSDLQQMLDGRALFLDSVHERCTRWLGPGVRRPGISRSGWLFLASGERNTCGRAIDGYAAYGAIAKRGSLPGADTVAVIGASTFIPMIMLLGYPAADACWPLSDRPSLALSHGHESAGGLAGIVARLLSPYHGRLPISRARPQPA